MSSLLKEDKDNQFLVDVTDMLQPHDLARQWEIAS